MPAFFAYVSGGVLGPRNTIGTVAAYLGCSTATVNRRIKSGVLACTRHGRIVRISKEQVEAFERLHTTGLTPSALEELDQLRLDQKPLDRGPPSQVEQKRQVWLDQALVTERRRSFCKRD